VRENGLGRANRVEPHNKSASHQSGQSGVDTNDGTGRSGMSAGDDGDALSAGSIVR
jgi:hypothetical protein